MYFRDLEPCTCFGRWSDVLTAVGWLEPGHDFVRGDVRKEFFSALVRLLVNPWQPFVSAGRKPCGFCRFTGGSGGLSFGDDTIHFGGANLFVPAADRVFAAPSMIAHYVDAHGYAPPAVFQEAVMRCPDMRSAAYLKAIAARGLTGST